MGRKIMWFVMFVFFMNMCKVYAQSDDGKELPDIQTFFQSVTGSDTLRCIPGMFNTYVKNGNYYWEIPDTLFGRDMAIVTVLVKGAELQERSLSQKYGYGGDLIGAPLVVRFEKGGSGVEMMVPFFDRLPLDSLNELYEIERQRLDAGVISDLMIKAKGVHSVLVDVTSLLNKSDMFTLSSFAFLLNIGGYEQDKSYVTEIRGFKRNIIIRFAQSYSAKGDMKGASGSGKVALPTRWEVGVSINLLPKEPMRRRYSDRRVGYFTTGGFQDFATDPYRVQKKYPVKRWHLEPSEKDLERYKQGQLVVPEKPIVFYIDRETPTHLVPYFIEAVNVWQKVFEKVGFKEAIRAELAPTAEEDPEFSVDNARYSFISYKTSPVSNAYGPSSIDPRTGEILCSHVGIYSSVFDLVQRWYFCQCGLTDERARMIALPDTLLGKIIQFVLVHEIGHTIGLKHNFIGSDIYSLEQIRDKEFVRKYGYGASIMDYMRFNYVAQPKDSIDVNDLLPRVGEYDEFAVEWGYRYFPEMTLAEEQKYLDDWVTEKVKKRVLRFGDENGRDPRSQSEDLSDNDVKANILGMENLRELASMSALWQVEDENARRVMAGRYDGMIMQYQLFVNHVLLNIGGKYFLPDSYQETGQLYLPVSRERQKESFVFLDKYVFTPSAWLFNDDITRCLDVNAWDKMEKVYAEIINALCLQFENIMDNNQYPQGDTYTLDESLDEIHNCVFRDWESGEPLTRARVTLQRIYVSQLKALVDQDEIGNKKMTVSLLLELKHIGAKAEACGNFFSDERSRDVLNDFSRDINRWINRK